VGDPRSPSFRPPAHLDDVRRGVAPAERSRVVAVDGCGLAEESQNLNRCHPVARSGELPNCGSGNLGIRRWPFGLTRFAQRGDGNRERRHGSQDRYGDYAFRHPYMMTQDPLLG
jgi:hypothetical protein